MSILVVGFIRPTLDIFEMGKSDTVLHEMKFLAHTKEKVPWISMYKVNDILLLFIRVKLYFYSNHHKIRHGKCEGDSHDILLDKEIINIIFLSF